jgi:hypothetical protein
VGLFIGAEMEGKLHSQEKKFYVYKYLRSIATKNGALNTPYYVGKGQNNRAYAKGRLFKPNNTSFIEIVCTSMNDADALQLEMLFIHLYGRLDIGTGCLRNRTDGGEGCSVRLTKEQKIIRSRLLIADAIADAREAKAIGKYIKSPQRQEGPVDFKKIAEEFYLSKEQIEALIAYCKGELHEGLYVIITNLCKRLNNKEWQKIRWSLHL